MRCRLLLLGTDGIGWLGTNLGVLTRSITIPFGSLLKVVSAVLTETDADVLAFMALTAMGDGFLVVWIGLTVAVAIGLFIDFLIGFGAWTDWTEIVFLLTGLGVE